MCRAEHIQWISPPHTLFAHGGEEKASPPISDNYYCWHVSSGPHGNSRVWPARTLSRSLARLNDHLCHVMLCVCTRCWRETANIDEVLLLNALCPQRACSPDVTVNHTHSCKYAFSRALWLMYVLTFSLDENDESGPGAYNIYDGRKAVLRFNCLLLFGIKSANCSKLYWNISLLIFLRTFRVLFQQTIRYY